MMDEQEPEETGPIPSEANPGQGTDMVFNLSDGEQEWEESINLAVLLAEELEAQEYIIQRHETWLVHEPTGLMLLPQMAEVDNLESGAVRTVTTIEVFHPDRFPNGLFEYQHATGDDLIQSMRQGFSQWAQSDFVTHLAAAEPQENRCLMMEMEIPATSDKLAFSRQLIFGPVAHYRQEEVSADVEGEHPFCNCCLFTQSVGAFAEQVQSDEVFGLRLFAMRNENGEVDADCRVNGQDHEGGKQALIEYAKTWPPAGFEFRKQYVMIQNKASS